MTAINNLPFLREAKGFNGGVLGGWKVSDITTLRSGTSLSPGLSISKQGNAVRADRVPGTSIHGPKTKKDWFNTAAFQAPQAGSYGNGATGSIQGPGLVVFDMSLYKEFHFTESNFFEFRSEAFNIFNHTNFHVDCHELWYKHVWAGHGCRRSARSGVCVAVSLLSGSSWCSRVRRLKPMSQKRDMGHPLVRPHLVVFATG